MRVEPAVAKDVDALADAWVALAAEQREHGSHLHAASNRDRVRESMAHHVVNETCLVAREPPSDDSEVSARNDHDERFLGFVTFALQSGGYDVDAVRGTVENLHVTPEFRGHGVGAALLEAAERELASRGVEVVTLEVLAANERARAFYAREGYDDQRVVAEKRIDVETDTKGNRGQ